MAKKLSQDDYDYVLAEFVKSGKTPEQAEALMKTSGYEGPGLGSKALDYGLRALDYSSGVGRGAVGGALQAASGKDLGVNFLDVLRGKAPTTDQMMERGGVPQGGELSDLIPGMYSETGQEWTKFQKGGMLDPSARGTVGFAGDVAADPLTWLSLGTAPALKAGIKAGSRSAQILDRTINPIARGIEGTGEMIFKSGVKKLDAKAVERGGEAVSPYLLENGIWGTNKGIQKGMDSRLADLGLQRSALYDEAARAGAVVDPAAASKGALDYTATLRNQPYADPAKIASMEEFINRGIKPDPEALAKAQAEFAAKNSQYGVAKENFVRDAKQYRTDAAAYRKAGGSADQSVFPFLLDDAKAVRSESVPLIGAEADVMKAPGFDLQNAEQLGFGPANVSRANLQTPIQRAADGTSLTPAQFGQAEMPFSDVGTGQMLMALPPSKPVRPVAPTMLEVGAKPESLAEASATKTQLYDKLPESMFDPLGRISPDGAELNRALAEGRRQEIIRAADSARPGMGGEIDAINQEMGAYLGAQKPLRSEILKGTNKNTISQVDGILSAAQPLMFAGKKAAQVLNATPVRTGGGLLMNRAGQVIPESVWRQMFLEPPREDQ
jgi:hypothetical protein